MIPLIIAGAVGIALLISGCSSEEDKEEARSSEGRKCDSFEKPNSKYQMIDQASFDTMKYIWGKDIDSANAGNWHKEARVFIGAAADLFKTSCTNPAVDKWSVRNYLGSIRHFLEEHYEKKASQAEDGMLVLIAGLAPSKLDSTIMQDALSTMVQADESQRPFSQVLLACQRFNMVMDDYKERFLRIGEGFPTLRKDSSKSDMWNVGSILDVFDSCENIEVGRRTINSSTIATCRTECNDRADIDQVLSDRQQVILNSLKQAYYYYTTGQTTRPIAEEFPTFITTDKDSCKAQNLHFPE
ncbi:MAG: hypothetical protein WC683_15475 [bacterium]